MSIATSTHIHPPPSINEARYTSSSAGPSRLPAPLPFPHHQSGEMPPPSSTQPSRKRKLAPTAASPMPSSPSSSSADAQDGAYTPVQATGRGGTKRTKAGASQAAAGSSSGGAARGGSSGKGMSREALRKQNHSLIERRRREKINHALGELRDMVPGLGDAEGGKGGEFKLEVLERTVDHMKDLKAHIQDLEARLAKSPSAGGSSFANSSQVKAKSSTSTSSSTTTGKKPSPAPRHSASPPTPSQSPDPNETDAEPNLPPAYTLAARPSPPQLPSSTHSSPSSPARHTMEAPSITSLLASLPDRQQPVPSSRPQPASSQAYNPTLYLPFPTPSPTSPFLSYGSHSHSSSAASSGPPEPSPFIAPLQGIALFGGALSLDNPSPADAFVTHNPVSAGGRAGKGGDTSKEQEDAANVLLAFSSPDVMRPMGYMTPLVAPAEASGVRERRGTLDSEDFVLDGGVASRGMSGTDRRTQGEVRGKTARDILRM